MLTPHELEPEPCGYCELEKVEFSEKDAEWQTGCPFCGTNCWELKDEND